MPISAEECRANAEECERMAEFFERDCTARCGRLPLNGDGLRWMLASALQTRSSNGVRMS
jgi:hypothetical protein